MQAVSIAILLLCVASPVAAQTIDDTADRLRIPARDPALSVPALGWRASAGGGAGDMGSMSRSMTAFGSSADSVAPQRGSAVPVLGMSFMFAMAFSTVAHRTALDRAVEVPPLMLGLGAGVGAAVGANAARLKPARTVTIASAVVAAVPLVLVLRGQRGKEPSLGGGLALVGPSLLPMFVAWGANAFAQ